MPRWVGGILGGHLCRQPTQLRPTFPEDGKGSHKESLPFQEPAHPSGGAWCGQLMSKGSKVGLLDSKPVCLAGSLSNLDQVIYCVWASVFSVK